MQTMTLTATRNYVSDIREILTAVQFSFTECPAKRGGVAFHVTDTARNLDLLQGEIEMLKLAWSRA